MNKREHNIFFSKTERRGIILLTIIFIAATLLYFSLDKIFYSDTTAPQPLDNLIAQLNIKHEAQPEIKSIRKNSFTQKQEKKKKYIQKKKSKKSFSYPPIQAFSFDPNVVSKSDLLKMKLAPHLAQVIMNYRNRGGVFKKKEDLKKIYGITDSIYTILEPHISLPEKSDIFKPRDNISTISFVELNSATAKDLESLRGIGPVLSKRIVKFRDKLGGFHSIGQLNDVYGIEDSLYQSLLPMISVQGTVDKININVADLDELKSHPFLDYKRSKIIINYRNQHGPFKNVAELLNIKIFKAEDLEKIKPYLTTL